MPFRRYPWLHRGHSCWPGRTEICGLRAVWRELDVLHRCWWRLPTTTSGSPVGATRSSPSRPFSCYKKSTRYPPPSPPSRQHPHCIVCPSNMITSQVSLEGQAFQGRSAIHSCSEVFVEAGQHLSVMQFVFQTIPGVGAFHSQLSG